MNGLDLALAGAYAVGRGQPSTESLPAAPGTGQAGQYPDPASSGAGRGRATEWTAYP